jgi:hypothetical protein
VRLLSLLAITENTVLSLCEALRGGRIWQTQEQPLRALEWTRKSWQGAIRVAKKAIHSQTVKLHKADEAENLGALMEALNVLDHLLEMNQTDLPRRA